MQKPTKVTRTTIHFQPTEEVSELLEIALGKNPKRGDLSFIINQAIQRKLPEVMREIQDERNARRKAVASVRYIFQDTQLTPEQEREAEAFLKENENPPRRGAPRLPPGAKQ